MCHESCINFGKKTLKAEYINSKSVIEVGSMDINGSIRPVVESFKPVEYIGVDIEIGPGVDQICSAECLIGKFGRNRFDVVICTEVLEHVKNWKKVIHNLKQITKPGGMLFITTRSKGFFYHSYPFDFWRYEITDMERILRDFDIKMIETDPQAPGIFVLAKKPEAFIENKISNFNLYSVIFEKKSSIAGTSIWLKIVNVPINMLKLLGLITPKNREYYIPRIILYLYHPFRAFAKIGRKLLESIRVDKRSQVK